MMTKGTLYLKNLSKENRKSPAWSPWFRQIWKCPPQLLQSRPSLSLRLHNLSSSIPISPWWGRRWVKSRVGSSYLKTFQWFFFPPPSESKISKIQLSFSSGVLIIIANFACIHFTSSRALFPSYHQHCDDIIIMITVMFSWKSMLPLLSSSNIPYTESHKMPPCVTIIIAFMLFYIINIFFAF